MCPGEDVPYQRYTHDKVAAGETVTVDGHESYSKCAYSIQ